MDVVHERNVAGNLKKSCEDCNTFNDGIAYLLRNYPQLTEVQVAKMMGTTKETIQKVRDRTHWNSANIKPRDPVILGLCSQTDLNAAVSIANERLEREGKAVPPPPPPSDLEDGE